MSQTQIEKRLIFKTPEERDLERRFAAIAKREQRSFVGHVRYLIQREVEKNASAESAKTA